MSPRWRPRFAFPATAHEAPLSPHPLQRWLFLVFLIPATLAGARGPRCGSDVHSLVLSDADRLLRCCWPSGPLLWGTVCSWRLPIFKVDYLVLGC